MSKQPPSLLHRLIGRIFPSMPNFFGLLEEQCTHASHTVGLLVEFMDTGDEAVSLQIRHEEHEADLAKARNLQILNESFATPVDREDIYRAIMALDEVVNYCKTTMYEMHDFAVPPDRYLLEMATLLKEGVDALAHGFGKLPKALDDAATAAKASRKAERNIEKAYRRALAELFEGNDYNMMLKRREIYRHMSNAGDRLAGCAGVLNDIIVKIG
jgi:uncharacterized protein Yka (UPF0111/DUF47 family)